MDIVQALQELAQAAGAIGLLFLALADSAGFPTGGGPDVLLLLQASQESHLSAVAGLVLLAAGGSTVGCFVLYVLGRRGGRLALNRFPAPRVEGVRRRLVRHGPWVIFLAVMAPPPYPTKLLILCAGAVGMRPLPTGLSIFAGRALRYGLGGYLGMRFGAHALGLVQQNAWWFGVALLLLMLTLAGSTLCRRRQTA